MIAGDTAVLSLQNGWGNAPRIASIVGEDRVLVGLTYHGGTLLAPGRVKHPGVGMTYIGELTGKPTERLGRVIEAFRGAQIETTQSDRILDEVWKKLALNACTLPVAGLLRFMSHELVAFDGTKSLMAAILREVVAVAKAQGIALDYDERWAAITGLLEKAIGGKASMLQDVEAKRQTEIEVINGAIVDAGAGRRADAAQRDDGLDDPGRRAPLSAGQGFNSAMAPRLEIKRPFQILSRRAGARRRVDDRRARRNPRVARRKWRRQVDARQDRRRRLFAQTRAPSWSTASKSASSTKRRPAISASASSIRKARWCRSFRSPRTSLPAGSRRNGSARSMSAPCAIAQATLIAQLGVAIDPALKVSTLSPAQAQIVEIAKALSRDLRILILDEPTAALTLTETEKLFDVVRRLAAQRRLGHLRFAPARRDLRALPFA